MADIELVIKIPEEKYNQIINRYQGSNVRPKDYEIAIINGIQLPKSHGDLKDMGNLQYVFDLTREDPIYSGKDIELAIKSMKTVIEADKENKK